MESSTLAAVPGALADGVGGVPASLPGPGGLKVLGHCLAFDILQERSVCGGVKLGARTRSCSGRGWDGEGGGTYLTYLFAVWGSQGPSPSCQCSHPAGKMGGGEGGARVAARRGLESARGVCARREVRGHTCDINLATGCVRALPLLLPSCGLQRGGGGGVRLAALGGGGGQRERRRGEGGGGWGA